MIPGLGKPPGEGDGYPLQYFCLENSMDRGAWQATVHGVAESDMTEQISLQDGRLSRPRQAQGVVKAQGRRPHLARVGDRGMAHSWRE